MKDTGPRHSCLQAAGALNGVPASGEGVLVDLHQERAHGCRQAAALCGEGARKPPSRGAWGLATAGLTAEKGAPEGG